MEKNKSITQEDVLSLKEKLDKLAREHNLSYGFNRKFADGPLGYGPSNNITIFVSDFNENKLEESFQSGLHTLEDSFDMHISIEKLMNSFIEKLN